MAFSFIFLTHPPCHHETGKLIRKRNIYINTGFNMNEPDYDYVYNQLRKVKNDVSFREEVADWAQHTVYEIYIQ